LTTVWSSTTLCVVISTIAVSKVFMARIAASDFSYRNDPAVPRFDDSKAVFVFDGICVLCSTGVSWIMRNDKHGRVNFATAQSPLGQALYRHYGVEIDGSYLLVEGGRAYTVSARLSAGRRSARRVLASVSRRGRHTRAAARRGLRALRAQTIQLVWKIRILRAADRGAATAAAVT
jgi:hypothetical protein